MAENEPAFVDSVQNFLSDKVCTKGAYLESMVTHNNIAHIRSGKSGECKFISWR